LTEILAAGSVIFDREVEPIVRPQAQPVNLPPQDIMQFLQAEETDTVPVILKTESAAEMEAIKNALSDKVRLIYEGQGEVGVSEILMAKDFHALVLAFGVDINREAKQLAESENVFFKSYNIIYQLLDELDSLITALAKGEMVRELGKGEIQASFLGTSGTIIGLKVNEGRLAVGDRVKILRGEKEMGHAKIISIRHGKEDVKIANKNTECGVMLDSDVDFAPQDAIIAYSKT